MKTCKKCGVEKEDSFFRIVRPSKGNPFVRCDCKQCEYQDRKKWIEANLEKAKAYQKKYDREYSLKNRAAVHRNTAKWQKKNPDKQKLYRKASYDRFAEQRREYSKQRNLNLTDSYVKALMRERGFTNEQLEDNDLIESYRLIVKTQRYVKQQKNTINSEHSAAPVQANRTVGSGNGKGNTSKRSKG